MIMIMITIVIIITTIIIIMIMITIFIITTTIIISIIITTVFLSSEITSYLLNESGCIIFAHGGDPSFKLGLSHLLSIVQPAKRALHVHIILK